MPVQRSMHTQALPTCTGMHGVHTYDHNIFLPPMLVGDQFTDDFKKVNPNSKIPAIVDPDGPGKHASSLACRRCILTQLSLLQLHLHSIHSSKCLTAV